MKRAIVGIIAAFFLVVTMSACSQFSPASDEQGIEYKGGITQSKEFEACVKPSDKKWTGMGNSKYYYPAGQRTYSFTGKSGSESDPVTIKTHDSQELSVSGVVTFELTDDCKKLQEFHEQVGAKYKAYSEDSGDTSDGWDKFLNDYIAVPLNATMDKAGLEQNWRTLYSSADAQTAFEEYVKENLPSEVKAALGEDYLVIKSVSIETPVPSEGLRDGLAAKEEAKLQNEAQEELNKTLRTKYDSFKDCRKVLSESACVTLNLAEQGDIPFYPVPDGGSINVQPQPKVDPPVGESEE